MSKIFRFFSSAIIILFIVAYVFFWPMFLPKLFGSENAGLAAFITTVILFFSFVVINVKNILNKYDSNKQ
ncbi:hypothetical protein [Companilactobacillus sp. DQM5]|uniref:hypothetical protein n=1 Tax=Companilactobacillus sp. DQM5 TaxID=3463359 RepID=UPI004058DEAF